MPLGRAKNLLRDVVDLLYPTACAFCETHVDGAGPLCPSCLADLEHQEDEAACPACAKPLAQHGDPCPYCEGSGEPNFEKIVRLGVYADPIRHLVYRAKYHGRWALAEFFADRLTRQPAVVGLLNQTDCLVPVPLHRVRQIARGYNQAEVLARRLKKLHRLPVVRPLVRVRHTEAQVVVKSRAKREQNLREAFGLIDAKAVAGRHVVIVDDITTTGATLQSVARALKPAKPASLSAVVIAVADPRGRDFEVI
ncbi:MAG: Competence protein F homolog, phosphoribosyltransferase domain; protein YhgH required for utilization of DNA as sole source of carbon and energy [uncultured Phycisphaerae bacterium]|uniref:Competence protein F homolog, phosphoribosyltransferase domain protein YhgH required for utilization of DNA as sole source of carbon and energy n=1 Tax=uncultured Phycisphaerae bacterium TaxID=904963 RepID=A0A6J4Q484_9BACT|nr:MAG: Competence protein F homolog, phosphoribosyltransferase domain; protein YhgH required for utilization of DNA as sole source of carbon and energy [uncultured Phycisphaerae bacterium]